MTLHSPVPTLLHRHLLEGPVDVVQLLKGSLGPDAEPPHVSTWCKLQQVKTVHFDQVHTGYVPERVSDAMVLGVDDQRSLTQLEATVTHLPLTSTDSSSVCKGGGSMRMCGVRNATNKKLPDKFIR